MSSLEKKNPLFGFHVLSLAPLEKALYSQVTHRHFYNQLFFLQMIIESVALDKCSFTESTILIPICHIFR